MPKSASKSNGGAMPAMTDQDVIARLKEENASGTDVWTRLPNMARAVMIGHNTLANAPFCGVVSAADCGGNQKIANTVNVAVFRQALGNNKFTSIAQTFTVPQADSADGYASVVELAADEIISALLVNAGHSAGSRDDRRPEVEDFLNHTGQFADTPLDELIDLVLRFADRLAGETKAPRKSSKAETVKPQTSLTAGLANLR